MQYGLEPRKRDVQDFFYTPIQAVNSQRGEEYTTVKPHAWILPNDCEKNQRQKYSEYNPEKADTATVSVFHCEQLLSLH